MDCADSKIMRTRAEMSAFVAHICEEYLTVLRIKGYDTEYKPLIEWMNHRADQILRFNEGERDSPVKEWIMQNFLWTMGFQREFFIKYGWCGNPAGRSENFDFMMWDDTGNGRLMLELYRPKSLMGVMRRKITSNGE